jgi:hypothetical protein
MYQADLWHSHHWIDIRDWLGAITTALAAGFAAYAIWQSKRQAEKSNQALIAERRADYALDILRDLAEFVSKRWQRCRPERNREVASTALTSPYSNRPCSIWC